VQHVIKCHPLFPKSLHGHTSFPSQCLIPPLDARKSVLWQIG
jgi:hypothetical protein